MKTYVMSVLMFCSIVLGIGINQPVEAAPEYINQDMTSLDRVLANLDQGVVYQSELVSLHRVRTLRQLYRDNNNQYLWLDGERLSSLGLSLIKKIREADTHALNPRTYHANLLSSLSAYTKIEDPAGLDVILTDAFIAYKDHLTNGVLNPKEVPENLTHSSKEPEKIIKTWNTQPIRIDYRYLYYLMKQSGKMTGVLDIGDPTYQVMRAEYNRLKQAYNTDEAREERNRIKRYHLPYKTLRVGDRGASVLKLKHLLNIASETDVFDSETQEAVIRFQKQNGLDADGVVGFNTLLFLNKTDDDKIKALVINMERWRWNNFPSNVRYVWINIPSYTMEIRKNNERLFFTKTIVGRKKRPTPIFSDRLESVVFAPYWNVPETIFNEDKLPKLQKDATAFKNIEVLDIETNQVVEKSEVDWVNDFEKYRLRQKPGKRNALGLVKFMFPNKHDVYMHDTPGRRLFTRSTRAFSSGCIRLERAEDFAYYLLEGHAKYDKETIQALFTADKEKWVNVKDKYEFKVFINYFTAWVPQSKKVRYEWDVYKYDDALYRMYQQAVQ